MRRLSISCILLLGTGCGGSLSTDDWLQQLKDCGVVKRRQAIRELAVGGTEDERIAPALAEALHGENPYVRRDAAVALAKFGPAAKRTRPALTAALKDKKRSVRKAAARSLQQIASPRSVPLGPLPRDGT